VLQNVRFRVCGALIELQNGPDYEDIRRSFSERLMPERLVSILSSYSHISSYVMTKCGGSPGACNTADVVYFESWKAASLQVNNKRSVL
jgi:hypothetical protein